MFFYRANFLICKIELNRNILIKVRYKHNMEDFMKRVAVATVALISLIFTSGAIIDFEKSYALMNIENKQEIGIIDSEHIFENIVGEIEADFKQEFGESMDLGLNVEVIKANKSKRTEELSNEELRTLIYESVSPTAVGYEVFIGDKRIATLKTQEEADIFMEDIKKPFLSHGEKVIFSQEIVSKSKRVNCFEIMTLFGALSMMDQNIELTGISREEVKTRFEGESLSDITITYIDTVSELISYDTVIKESSTLYRGTEEIIQSGIPGLIQTKKEVVEKNGIVIEETAISSQIKYEPTVEIIVRGTKSIPTKQSKIVDIAKNYIGVPYVWGGTTPEGFDCSGLVQYVFREAGIKLPRTSAEQGKVGEYIEKEDLKPGDLVCFPGHIGIYIGEGQFLHAPDVGQKVRINSLDAMNNFTHGRRLEGD